MTLHGEIVRLEAAHGFGFIKDDRQGDWFFVAAGVERGGLADLWVGARVGFRHESTPQGPRATSVHLESAE